MRNTWLAVLAVVEAIALFALLFAVASDGRPLAALGVISGTLILCVVALRLINVETFRWLPERGALGLLVAVNVLAGMVVATR